MTSDPTPAPFIEHPPDDFWEWSAALDPVSPVRVVSALGGFVAAAGERLHMVRPGAQRVRSFDLPPDLAPTAVAAEPWSPFRLGIAWPGHVAIFAGHRPIEPTVELGFADPKADATHIAWVRDETGESKLHLRRRSGEVSRLSVAGSTQTLTTPNAAAITADADGVLAVLALLPPEEAEAWILPPGAREWDVRILVNVPVGDDAEDWHVYLSAHGKALAYSMDDVSADVSWEENEDDSRHFETPPAVFQGPIAFQSGSVIFAAYNVEGQVNVLRYVRGGGVTRVARFGLDDASEGTPVTVTGLAWDEARRTLWAASPELGLLRLKEPARATPAPAPAKPAARKGKKKGATN